MSYVLVSVVGEGDAGTQASDAFARWYAKEYPPAAPFHGEAPDHAAITNAVLGLSARRGFVLAHGGETLRAFPGASPLNPFQVVVVWADAAQFAAMFQRARVDVFACSTLSEAEDGRSFGRAAVELGVAAYAGHFKPVQAPGVSDVGLHDEHLRLAIARVVKTFLDGCDDVDRLLMEARSAFSNEATVPLEALPLEDVPSFDVDGSNEVNDPTLPLEWSLDWARILGSLRVELPRA